MRSITIFYGSEKYGGVSGITKWKRAARRDWPGKEQSVKERSHRVSVGRFDQWLVGKDADESWWWKGPVFYFASSLLAAETICFFVIAVMCSFKSNTADRTGINDWLRMDKKKLLFSFIAYRVSKFKVFGFTCFGSKVAKILKMWDLSLGSGELLSALNPRCSMMFEMCFKASDS